MRYADLSRDDREDLYAFMCRRLDWQALSLMARTWLRARMPEAAPEEPKKRWGRGWLRN